MINFRQTGNFDLTVRFLQQTSKNILPVLEKYGIIGVSALEKATPKDTGKTSRSWKYEITKDRNGYRLSWYNTNMHNGTPIVILIQYGHGTKGGRFISGRDFINPAMKPIFDSMAKDIWKEVANK